MKRTTFSTKVVVAAASVAILGFGCFALVNDNLQERTVSDNLSRYMTDVGGSTAENISQWMKVRTELLTGAAEMIKIQSSDEAVRQVVSLDVMHKNFGLTYYGRSEIKQFIHSPSIDMPDDYDFRTRPTYKAAVEAGKITLKEPYIDAATQELVASIAAPVFINGILNGVIGVDLSLTALIDLVERQKIGGLGYAFIVNESGKVIVSSKKDDTNKQVSDVYGQAVAVTDKSSEEVGSGNASRILYFKKILGLPDQNWYVGISIDKAQAYSALSDFRVSAGVALTGTVAGIVIALAFLIHFLLAPIRSMNIAMRDIADGEGDLTKRLNHNSNDEFGELSASFNKFVERIGLSISAVDLATSELNQLSGKVLQNSRCALGSSQEQADRVVVVAASVEELGATAQEIAASAVRVSDESSKVKEMSFHGQELAKNSMTAIDSLSERVSASKENIGSLSEKTEKIGKILDVITGISEQTNLLALNAAIEAARAGEAGRGFAVVADEVRNLAHRTQSSASEINLMITDLQSEARTAVSVMLESQAQGESSVSLIQATEWSIAQINARMSEIDGMNHSVATATEEQTTVVHSLSVEIHEVNRQNIALTEELNKNIHLCAGLDEQAAVLRKLVGSFKLA